METKDSVEQETVQQEAETAAAEQAEKAAEAAEAEQAEKKELTAEEKLQKQFDELNDRYMRMAAEYDNFRKRVVKERDMIRSEATGKALTAILPIYDNLERALAQETADTEYKKGVEMTARQFEAALESLGVEIITAEPGSRAPDPSAFPRRCTQTPPGQRRGTLLEWCRPQTAAWPPRSRPTPSASALFPVILLIRS